MISKEKVLNGRTEISQRRISYLKELPGFVNLLLLLLESGMILQEAFHRVVDAIDEKRRKDSVFYDELSVLCRQSRVTGENVIVLFHQFSRSCGVKEVLRISSLMEEHIGKGVDLREALSNECEWLWQEKKRGVLENIRLRESKMSFPLALLLISLLLISVGPAFLQM